MSHNEEDVFDITIIRGDTYEITAVLKDADDELVDLTDATGTLRVYKNAYATTPLVTTAAVIDEDTSTVVCTLTDEQTEALSMSCGRYHLEIVYSDGKIAKPLYGEAHVKRV